MSKCDGEWEHESGVSISTLDNPGWILTVNLMGTDLADRAIEVWSRDLGTRLIQTEEGRKGSGDWMECRVSGGKWVGAGDTAKLRTIAETFRDWATRR